LVDAPGSRGSSEGVRSDLVSARKPKSRETLDLLLMTDLNVLYTMNVLNEVIAPAHNCDDNLPSLIICRWLCLAEDARPRNKCRSSASRKATAAPRRCLAVACHDCGAAFRHYSSTVLRFGQLGYDLVEQRGLKRFRARAYATFGSIVMPWTRPGRSRSHRSRL
jgi:hypothetical protein